MSCLRPTSACIILLIAIGACNDDKTAAIPKDTQLSSSSVSKVAKESITTLAQDPISPSQQVKQGLPDPLIGKVKETMAAGGYTYVLLATDQGDHWAAAKQFDVAVGDKVSVAGLMPMSNFASPTLKRTFKNIQFVSRASVVDGKVNAGKLEKELQSSNLPSGHLNINGQTSVSTTPLSIKAGDIEVQPGSVTVSELFEKKSDLNGKTVKFSGLVTKVNRGILGSNWLHIQDGTGSAGSNDITVTSKTGFAEVGSAVLIEGVLAIEKDFGAGYKYDVIVEDALITIVPAKPGD